MKQSLNVPLLVALVLVFHHCLLVPSVDAFSVRLPVTSTASSSSIHRPLLVSSEPSSSFNDPDYDSRPRNTIRSKLRDMTGFSLTALRATFRGVTGISLSAICAACGAATSGVVRNTMALLLKPIPTWARYFIQPFLIMYYVPLFMIRTMADRKSIRDKQTTHDALISDWKMAIDTARTTVGTEGYWPVKVNDEGDIEMVASTDPNMPVLDLNSAVVESIELALQSREGGSHAGGCDI